MNFTTNINGTSDGYCLIKSLDKKLNVKGVPYLDMVLCDKTGEINAKIWDYKKEIHGEYCVGDLVKIRGNISQYNGADQLRIDKIRHVTEGDGVNMSDFVPSAEYSGEMMLAQIYKIIDSMADEEIKKLTYSLIKESEEKMLFWPAAFKLHHAMRGGLLYHTLSIIKLAKSVCEIYPSVDRDLLFCGIILHDICKIDEFELSSAGMVTKYSVKGELLGHLVMGAMKVSQKARELGISEEKATLVEHMIISHHGDPEFGAAVRPMFLEAEILSRLDTLDAVIFEIEEASGSVVNRQKYARNFRTNRLSRRQIFFAGV